MINGMELLTDKRLDDVSFAARGVYATVVAHLAARNLLVVELDTLFPLGLADEVTSALAELLVTGFLADFADGTVGVLKEEFEPFVDFADSADLVNWLQQDHGYSHENLRRVAFSPASVVTPQPRAGDGEP